ncbi:semaphorin-5A-like [Diadema antillarum]|uniref:semaphorin-5A-like n=1 Tax=Diadema antillarum TaxID=105358 RepID=UPI003A8A9562
MDFMARDAVVYRTLGPSRVLRTAQLNSKWLNNPNFVSSYEIGPYVYFFFRETAVEFSNCGQIIYSRVARVCKSDTGGHFLLEENWTTFRKARLNCSIPGQIPFSFNEIESTYYDNETGIIFTVFSTPSNSIHGSAICAYTLEAIDEAFNGPFKFQPNAASAWVSRPNASPRGCDNQQDRMGRPGQIERYLVDAQKYQLMDLAARPVNGRPLYVQGQEAARLEQIVVDTVQGKDRIYNVMFVGTSNGKIKKMVSIEGRDDACIVEELCVTPMHKCDPLRALKIDKVKNALYIGLPEAVVKVNVQRCHQFVTQRECLNARDPYCGWNQLESACTTYPKDPEDLEFWIQEMVGCPIVDNTVDGGFGQWSNWTQCTDPQGLEACMCRFRDCDAPRPQCGGANCIGEYQQVANCTGRPKSTSTAVDSYRPGFWGEWTLWGQCSAPCNGGIQSRVRECVNGQACVGDSTQTRECNKQTCEEIRHPTQWTPWLVHNVSEDGLLMQRFKYICRAQVPSKTMISVGRLKSKFKFCPFGTTTRGCWADSENFGGWTMWSPWQPCSSSCGHGVQVRHRNCFPDNAECTGQFVEKRDCLLSIPCPVNGDWNCWGEWSACSVTCGKGVRRRSRECSMPAPMHDGLDCVGEATEEEECDEGDCNKQNLFELPDWPGLSVRSGLRPSDPSSEASEGWKEWSKWTSCNHKGRRHRSRKCDTATPNSGQCVGCVKEIAWCFGNGEDSQSSIFQAPEVQRLQATPAKCPSQTESMEPLYFCVVALVSAVAGSIMSLSVYVSWHKNNKRRQGNHPDYDDEEDDFGDMGQYSDSEYSYDGSETSPAHITANPADSDNER